MKRRSKSLGAKWTQIWGAPIKKKPWDLDINKKASYSNIMVSPRFHMVIDRPIENDKDKIKLFVQPTNSN
jgi:hypothetical protein